MLERAHHRILFERLRTPFAEIDLVALNPATSTLALIEVKAARLNLDSDQLVGWQQRTRLTRAQLWMSERYSQWHVRSMLAVVADSGQITWVADFLS